MTLLKDNFPIFESLNIYNRKMYIHIIFKFGCFLLIRHSQIITASRHQQKNNKKSVMTQFVESVRSDCAYLAYQCRPSFLRQLLLTKKMALKVVIHVQDEYDIKIIAPCKCTRHHGRLSPVRGDEQCVFKQWHCCFGVAKKLLDCQHG